MVDRGRLGLRHGERCRRDDASVRGLPLVPGQELRVIDPFGIEALGEHHGRRHQGSGQGAAARFVGTGDAGESLLTQSSLVSDEVAGQSIPPNLPKGHAITNASPITFSSGM